MRTYTSLFTRFPDQNKAEVFAHFHWKSHEGETWQAPFAHLAELAAPEPWGFGGGDSHKSRDYPILTNYLNHTFLRVQAQDKINYNPDKRRSCFNTGLQTKEGNDIRSLAKIHFYQSIQLFLNKFMIVFSSGKVVSQEVYLCHLLLE